ncbi:acyltransferase family protein [Massilia sp. ST3]|uniref:acyltransferase family protein n=1 Tax=Massilia sp. ST3 TaxID=2824903 RepID=UPI001B83F5C5|nr:acyltransferase family protein [Massilia sp. ST3]MBQ5948034.1 acyltransferase family protein [Massilia sp. ST3]
MQTLPHQPAARLYFLDWVRILAFFVLIAYHIGMYYVSWDWHVKSPFASDAAEPFMMLSSPWRLTLLFFVAGAASRFLIGRLGTASFLRQRSLRLLAPLLFGMAVIVPPQPYLEVVEKLGYGDGFFSFMRLYYSAYGGFCREDCLDLPTWNHLWFVAYLWVYTMLLGLLAALLPPGRIAALATRAGKLLGGWRLLVLPALALGLVRILLAGRFPTTHGLVDDWYNHAAYFGPFLLGALMAHAPRFWEGMTALRWQALGLALASWAAIVLWNATPEEAVSAVFVSSFSPVMRCVYTLCTWSAIVAACGFARRHLDRDGPARRYLTEAVFPVYIAHQTLIVVLAHAFKPLRLAPGLEALVLAVLTIGGCFALFEAVRRVRMLRPLFGLAPLRAHAGARKGQDAAAPAQAAPERAA